MSPDPQTAAPAARSEPPPSGTVAFLFTDIEGSTKQWESKPDEMRAALARHDLLMHGAMRRWQGHVFKTVGDGFYVAFGRTLDAARAAHHAQRALSEEDWSAVDGLLVRMALHVGAVESRDGDYFGRPLNKLARLIATAHGGQVILSAAAADLIADDLPAGFTLEHLGEHRLKDLETAERIYQLAAPGLRRQFPPLRSLELHPNNLPLMLTSFVGREAEVNALAAALGEAHLVTLAGPGGVGKTRLALQVGAEASQMHEDGVWFVDFSAVRDAEGVAGEVAGALNLTLDPAGPPAASIVAALRNKRLLLILDCCEHVLPAVAALTAAILSAAPGVRILATTRQALEIGGERVFSLGTLDEASSVQLFADRARAAKSSFTLTEKNAADVAKICKRLDGIALAIELAAPKIVVLSPAQLLEKLGERFRLLAHGNRSALPRQQTLRALIDWSYDMLDERERTLFRRLAIFAGGWSLAAASAVCADDTLGEWDVFELLSTLVSKSLVAVDGEDEGRRYRMLDSIRDYAAEKLAESGEAPAIGERHAAFFAEAVVAAAPLIDSDEHGWRDRLLPDVDNVLATLHRSLEGAAQTRHGLALLAAFELAPNLIVAQEAARWFEIGARLLDGVDDTTAAAVLSNRGRIQWICGEPTAERRKTLDAALARARAAGDPDAIAYALALSASCSSNAGRLDEAEQLAAEAVAMSERVTPRRTRYAIRIRAVNDLQRGETARAREGFTALTQLERPGSEALAGALLNLAEVEFAVGNVEAALDAGRRAKAIYERTSPIGLALVSSNMGGYALALDRLDEAAAILREALTLNVAGGSRWSTSTLEHHALLAALRGKDEPAARLMGFTDERYRAGDGMRDTTELTGYRRLAGILRERLDGAEFDRLRAAGAAMTLEEALKEATSIHT
jgi:predicted ATPase/class 3 adenylate cyclase